MTFEAKPVLVPKTNPLAFPKGTRVSVLCPADLSHAKTYDNTRPHPLQAPTVTHFRYMFVFMKENIELKSCVKPNPHASWTACLVSSQN